jgi:hypothetical protein
MKNNNSFIWVFTVFLILTVAVYFGCENKAKENSNKANTKIETETPDITGKWTGIFDGKTTVLDITEQTDSTFSGKISISYRQIINQDVKGSFSPTTLKMTMMDQLHSRFQGEYSGNLSKDSENFSGTFALNLDGSKYSFNLNKNKGS